MKKLICLMMSFIASSVFAFHVDFKLDDVPVNKAIYLIYDEVLDRPYMLSDSLINDDRLISFKVTKKQDFEQFIKRYFANLNIKIYSRDGVDYITYVKPEVKRSAFIYIPKHQNADYLADFLRYNVEQEKVNTVYASKNKLVYFGTPEEISRVKQVLFTLDQPTKSVVVSAYILEVKTSKKEGSGLNLIAHLLNGKLGLNLGIRSDFENFITFDTGNFSALLELFKTDNRFNIVSSPTLRIKNGAKGSFSVGADVPVLGDVTEDKNGKRVQSINYQSSGIIFNVSPVVKKEEIDLNIEQIISDFVKTDTGVNNTPTLIKREVKTSLSVKDGSLVILGGLAQTKNDEKKTGFSFLPFITGKSVADEKTNILVLLKVNKV